MLTRPRTAVIAALAALGALAVCGLLAELVPAFQVRDSASLTGFATLQDTHLSALLRPIVHLGDADSYLMLAIGVLLMAVARGRVRIALVLGVVLVAAPASTELLKQLTASPRGTTWFVRSAIAEASWPSGHATAAMTLSLCAIIAAPPRLRALVAVLGALFSLSIAYAVVVLVHHFPSDVVGGYLMAATWALAAVAVLRARPQWATTGRHEAAGPPPRAWPVALPAAAALAVVLGLAARTDQLAARPSFGAAAIAIAAVGGGLIAVLLRMARG